MTDKRVVIIGCVVLFVLLVGIIICERRAPEAGIELMRSLFSSMRG